MKTWQRDEALEILVCGHPIEEIDVFRPYRQLRGNATRAFGLANSFARKGGRVGLIVDRDDLAGESEFVARNLVLVPRRDLAAAAARSETLVLACTNLRTLREHDSAAVTVAHPQKWIACCFDYNESDEVEAALQGAIGISFNNQLQCRSWLGRGLGVPIHLMPYGVEESGYIDQQIIEIKKPNAVWIGMLRMPRLLQQIVRFAEINPECEVRVVAGAVFDQSRPRGTPGSQDQPMIDHRSGPPPIERFREITRDWCGRELPRNVTYLGSCRGQNAELLGAASVALAFSRRAGQQHDDSKVLDYLRSGTPVLCDDGQPACRFVSGSGHGAVIPFECIDAEIRSAFLQCLRHSALIRRRLVAAHIRDNFGWPAIADKIQTCITKATATKPSAKNPVPPVTMQSLPNVETDLSRFKDRHLGQRCFVVGCAPSLREMNLGLLAGEWVFSVNRGYLAANNGMPQAAYHVVSDIHTYAAYAQEIQEAKVGQRFYRSDVCELKEFHDSPMREPVVSFPFHGAPSMDEGYFAEDLPKGVYRGFTVVLDAVQLAFWMGFSEVYIIGCDLSYAATTTHVYGTGAYEQRRRNDMPIDRVLGSMQVAHQAFVRNGRTLANAGVGGCLDSIPRIAFTSLFVGRVAAA